MYTKVVVGMDGREHAKDALALGKLIAGATDASLTVAGVLELDPRLRRRDPALAEQDEHYRGTLESTADSVGGRAVIGHSTSAARGLHVLSEDADADLIIVGSSHRGRAGQILAGNVGLTLLHGSPCSVAIAPVGYADAAPPSIGHLVVGVDGSHESELALSEAVDLARATHAPLRIVAAAEPPPVVYGKGSGGTVAPRELKEAIREIAQQHLDDAVARAPDDVTIDSTLVEEDPADALGRIAAENNGILVVGSRAYGPLRRVLLGSVSSKLVHSAPCPVIVHPRGAKETATAGATVEASSTA